MEEEKKQVKEEKKQVEQEKKQVEDNNHLTKPQIYLGTLWRGSTPRLGTPKLANLVQLTIWWTDGKCPITTEIDELMCCEYLSTRGQNSLSFTLLLL